MSLRTPVGEHDYIQGDANAPCTLVEYGDYECPHCGHAYPIVKRVQKHFGKRLRFVFRNFPLSEMHDLLFENQQKLGGALYLKLATELGLHPEALRESLEKRAFAAKVKSDFTGGVRSGVNGTPTFFINGERHDASFEYEDLVGAIEGALSLT
jgi:protein-disulfide isomerase